MIEAKPALLDGIRVLDLSAVIMGPYAGQILGDLGADVVKVEPPAGDSTRYTGPHRTAGMASLFLGVSRNKRSIILDLKQPAAQDALLRLVDGADILIHSMRPQKLEALGLCPAALRTRNPRLIFVGLYGFGEGGPYAGRPAYDDINQGMAGFADLTARQGGEPRYFPTIVADKASGLFAVNAILAALVQRERTGQGTEIEVPMYEAMVAFNLVEHMFERHFDLDRGELGYPRVLAPWRRPYRSRDGHVCVMPYTNAHWRAFFHEAGMPECSDDPRFADIGARTRHIDALYEILGEAIVRRTSAEWVDICERLGIPAAPVAGLADILDDAHLQSVGFFELLHDPVLGDMTFPGVPYRFNGVRPGISRPPMLGEHTSEVFAEAGIDPQTIVAPDGRNDPSLIRQNSI